MKSYLSNTKLHTEWFLILFLALLKLLIHFFTYDNFELHRDAYLYYAQSEHLAWGYIAVPPTIALIGKISTLIFGNTVFGLRFFPALIGSINVIIMGLAVKELGGKKTAIILASLAFIFSPSYLHVNALFQPVSFNHFYWLLSCYLILIMVKRNEPKMWIWIGLVFGLAFLNKYSIVFLIAAFALSLLISKYRHFYLSGYFVAGVVIGIIIISPNILWQHNHNWPVLHHMAELRETQLVHVKYSDFIFDQLLMNVQAILIWLAALLLLLFYKKEKQFRLFGFIYLFIILLLMLGSGKPYYTLGIYPILFAFGAYFTEKYVRKFLIPVSIFLVIGMVFALYGSMRFDGIPLTTFEKAINKGAFRWEDGQYYDLPQDMADMTGWKAIGQKVTDTYLDLEPGDRNNCDIFCYHYGQAGAVMFYGKEAGIPQPISYNGSFVFWSPDELTKDVVIFVLYERDPDENPDVFMPELFEEVELITTIDDPYFRENGTRIYLCKYPREETKIRYQTRMGETRNSYRRMDQ